MFSDFGVMIGRFNSTLPTLVNEEVSELQLDASGRLILSGRYLSGTDSYASGDAGLAAQAVRNDAGGALAGVDDGDYTPLQVTAAGELRVAATVNVDAGSQYAEDTAHVSGDDGEFVLSVRLSDINGSNAAQLADTNGDYQAIFTNDKGELYVKDTDVLAKLVDIETTIDNGIDVSFSPAGTEEYTVSDDLATGDGLIDISAGGFVDVAVLNVGVGETAFIYGWQWAGDGNAVARLVTEVSDASTVTYKTSLNSTSTPSYDEHWSGDGRIEIAGAANLQVKVQVRARGAGASAADNATGSMHARKI